MEKYILSILIIVALVGAVGVYINSQTTSITGAAFLSDRLCQPGFTSMLYVEKSPVNGYFKPTVVCVSGDRVPALRDAFVLGEENADRYDRFRTDPYRFRER